MGPAKVIGAGKNRSRVFDRFLLKLNGFGSLDGSGVPY